MKNINFILAFILMIFLGCGGSGGDNESGSNKDPKVISGEKVSFEILKSGGYEVRENLGESIKVIKTQAEFEKVYALTNSEQRKQIPKVDFTKNNVLALFYGGKTSSAYKIELKDLRLEKGVVKAYISKTLRAGHCGAVPDDITSPFVFVAYPKSAGRLVFWQDYIEDFLRDGTCPKITHTPKNVKFTNLIYIEAGFAMPTNSQHFEVIRDQKRYDAVYKESKIRLEKPSIDFENEVVIFLGMDYFSSGGYHIGLTKITKKSDHVIVDVKTTHPGDNCPVTGIMSAPRLFVKIAKNDSYGFVHGGGGIVFNETRVKEACD